jgi:hypothetical protein
LNHAGIDIATSVGTPIVSAISGRITRVGFNDTSGLYIVITDNDGNTYSYSHLNVAEGCPGHDDIVVEGQQIGATGDSGNVTGPHLDFTIRDQYGNTIDPMSILPNPVDNNIRIDYSQIGYDPASGKYYNRSGYPNGYPSNNSNTSNNNNNSYNDDSDTSYHSEGGYWY